MAHALLWYKLNVSLKFPEKVYWGPMSNKWTNSLTDSMEQSPSSESNQEVPQLVQKFPTFYGTWRFITMITGACHLSLPVARSVCAPPHYCFLKICFNVILPSMHRSSKWSFYLWKPCIHHCSPPYVQHVVCSLLQSPVIWPDLGPNIFLSLCSFLNVSHPYKATGKIMVLCIVIF